VALVKYQDGIPANGHHPSTNRARRRATTLIKTNALPLSQAANLTSRPDINWLARTYDGRTILLASLVIIVSAVLVLLCIQTDTHTDAYERFTPATVVDVSEESRVTQ